MVVFTASFEDFIYIILGLVWVIYSAYNAKKKQNAKKNPAPARKNKSFLDSIISEFGLPSEQSQPINPKPKHVDENVIYDIEPEISANNEIQELYSYDDEYEESNYTPPYDVIETETVVSSNNIDSTIVELVEKKKNKAYSIKKKVNRKRIDLRRAVIYSEILKKVHF